jgi:hypothetical protein
MPVEIDEIRKEVDEIMLERIAKRKTHLAQSSKDLSNAQDTKSARICDSDITNTLDNLRAKAKLITKI